MPLSPVPIAPLFPPIDLLSDFESIHPSRDELAWRWSRSFTRIHIPKSNPPRALNVEMVVTPQQAQRGGTVPIDVPVARVCPGCQGTGASGYYHCDLCDGHGLEWEMRRIDVLLSPPVRDGTIIEVPLKRMGVSDFYLRLHARVTDSG